MQKYACQVPPMQLDQSIRYQRCILKLLFSMSIPLPPFSYKLCYTPWSQLTRDSGLSPPKNPGAPLIFQSSAPLSAWPLALQEGTLLLVCFASKFLYIPLLKSYQPVKTEASTWVITFSRRNPIRRGKEGICSHAKKKKKGRKILKSCRKHQCCCKER